MAMHLFIPGIKGESTDPDHKDWIDIESFSWGVNRTLNSNSSTKGDREVGNAQISDLHIVRNMDSSTSKLFLDACCGKGKEIKLELTKTGTGSGSETYMKYVFTNAVISNYTVNGTSSDTSHPTETITIAFIKVDMSYNTHDDDGVQCSSESVGFCTATNSKS